MSLSLQVTIFDGDDFTIKGTYPLLTYSLLMDAISNATSSLSLEKKSSVTTGDYVAVKKIGSPIIFYYGQITTVDFNDSVDTMSLTANYIWNVLNGEIIVKSTSGSSYEAHLLNMIKKYIDSSSSNSIIKYALSNSTNTDFAVTNSEISTSNLIDYMIRGFKLHNVIFDVTGIEQGSSNGKFFYYPKIDIHQTKDVWNFRNNVYDFMNWTVSDSRGLRGYNNELWIIDKASTNMENPTIMGKYWLQNDGSVVKSINNNVVKPTQVHIYLYDKTATDNPTLDKIAQTELQGNTYSHNIQFSMPINNNFLPLNKLKLGLQSNIYYNNKSYKSILTSYSLNSDSDTIALVFGNLRFGRNDLFSTTS